MRILVVEDDIKIASFIAKGLKAAGYAVDHALDGEEGLHMALSEPYDTAIIDIMLPKLDGLSLIEKMRKEKIRTPVIILSAKGSIDDRVKGLQTGGDDYLTKPFAFSNFWPCQALIRAGGISEATQLIVGELSVNLLTRGVTRGGKKIELQPLEFSLLEYLMRNKGRIVSKTMIMEHVWDYNFDPQTNVVEVRISRLRDKIDRGFDKKLIHTVRGVGYVSKKLNFWNTLALAGPSGTPGFYNLVLHCFLFYMLITRDPRETDHISRWRISTVLRARGLEAVKSFAFLEAQAAGVKKVFFRLLYPNGLVFSSSNLSYWEDIGIRKTAIEQLLQGSRPVFDTVILRNRQDKVRILYALIGPGIVLQVGQSMEDHSRIIEAFKRILCHNGPVDRSGRRSGWFMARRGFWRDQRTPGVFRRDTGKMF
jgi:two-component system OmpR family response regulator